ncbi:unknown [Prevotella sp. CAG:487]|nr:unknown [Prevotella sp. CAG:487]
MVKDKVQGDVPRSVKRHEARRNKAKKSGRESRIYCTEKAGVIVRKCHNTGNVCLMRSIRTVTSEAEKLPGSVGYMAAECRDTISYKP